MSPFEYVIVMISIILGLGITTILTGVAEMIKRTKIANLSAPYVIWIALVFVIHIQEWWVSYELKTVPIWTLHKFIFVLLYPINLYILAHLLFPTGLQKEFTAAEFYFNNYPKLFIATIILDIQSIIFNLTFIHPPLYTQVPHLIVLVILSTMVTTKSKKVWLHTAVSVLLLLVLLVSLAVENRKVY
jgi:hypothetical protein